MQHPADPVEVLHDDGAVETELLPELGDRRGRRLGARDDLGDVAGEHAQDGEHDDARHEQADDEQQQSPDEEPGHETIVVRR